ncbi:hypothetical protein BJY00DRAFT_271520 [Aspergillus carlsbadensis]|nr:hypothetical protein BJY00DRAFT_271520 [Aspergillus carlsbadensis]
MPELQATVVLVSLGLDDAFPHRVLTFESESDRIEIGRASKRENKNLLPSHQNALFDSRVMSRTHAILHASFEKKLLYIRDPGSMHGTWLNGEKLPVDKDITVNNGDVLTFGVEVVRGVDTFPPLAVRCECQWLETQYVPHCWVDRKCTNLDRNETVVQKQQTSNTFCVPEDDDEDEDDDNEYDDDNENDCEITSHNPVAFDLTCDQSSDSGSDSDASSVDSDSEDSHSVIEVQSPTSSPPKNGATNVIIPSKAPPMTAEPTHQSPIEQNNERSADSAQPLATPRMTPPSVDYESEDPNMENQYYDECFAHSSGDEGSDVDSEDWALNDEVDDAADDPILEPCDHTHFFKETLESVSDAAPVARTPSLDCLKKAAAAEHLPNDILGSWNISPFYGMNRLPEIKFNTPFQQAEQPVAGMSHTSPPRLPSLCQAFERVGSNMESSFQYGNSSEQLPAAIPTHSYTPMPAETMKASFSPQVDSSSGESSQMPSTHYKDGPFASTKPIVSTKSAGVTSASCSSKPEILPFMDPLAPMIPRLSCDVFPGPETEKSLAVEEWKTSNTGLEKTTSKKRKALEMESEPVEVVESVKLTNEKTDLPDSQKQGATTAINQQGTHITAVDVPKPSKEVDRPAKRAKASRTTSLRTHATTAIIGAVVGAVGTIAALASLPPDYFA